MTDKEERKETNTKEKNYKQSKNNKKGKNNNIHQDQDSNQTKSKQKLQFPNTTQPQIQPSCVFLRHTPLKQISHQVVLLDIVNCLNH